MNRQNYKLITEVNSIIGSLTLAEDVLKEIINSVESLVAITSEDSRSISDELQKQHKTIQYSINELLRIMVKCRNIRKNTRPIYNRLPA